MFPGKSPWVIQAGMGGVSVALFLVSMNFQGVSKIEHPLVYV